MAQSLESRPTVVDFREDSPWVKLAKAQWLDVKVRKVKPDVIKKQLWDPLEAEGFSSRSLLILENLNVLEKYGARAMILIPRRADAIAGFFGRRTPRMLQIIMSF